MLLSEAIEEWCSHRARMVDLNLVRESTWENQTQIAGTLKDHLGAHALDSLRKSHIEIYLGERLKTCAPVTVQGELNVLRQMFNWFVDEQLLTERPRLPTVKAAAAEPPLPGDEAFLAVLKAVPGHISRALEFMMLTGLSPHELEQLQPRDFFLAAKGIQIGGRPDFLVKQESRRRVIPLNDRAYAIWTQDSMGRADDREIFPTGAAMQKSVVRARRAIAAGAEITPKMMRKWFASKVAGEQPEHVLQRLMGHAPGSPITRRHYVRSSDSQLAGAVEGIGA